MNKLYYYNKGYDAAFSKRIIFAEGAIRSWQQKEYIKGYKAGIVYLEAEALLNGYEDKWKYQEDLIKKVLK